MSGHSDHFRKWKSIPIADLSECLTLGEFKPLVKYLLPVKRVLRFTDR